ncbi:MAG: ATP-binding protein [Lachnospiraceae bacterium]|nr:ATP-binding protein [Lachnospiraceae bacterium]
MLLSLKVNNCLIYNSEVEFSMRANMHYKRFPDNATKVGKIYALKTAVLIGPNNSGKTNFVRIIETMKEIMLGRGIGLNRNLFSKNPIVDASISFFEDGEENLFEIKYDVLKKEYVYERFAKIERDVYKNVKTTDVLLRDSLNKLYYSEDAEIAAAMKVAARNNILIYLIDTEEFPSLKRIKKLMTDFASRIDVVDMNNIPIKKTIDMLKSSDEVHQKVADFVLNADLYLDDFKYSSDDEIKIVLKDQNVGDVKPQENALSAVAPLTEMLHLTSVYKGVKVPSMLFDSTGTKKMAALASYVIEALENGRILVIDELDNSLHFRLTRAIIALFNNELNHDAQLIATVHDVSLLDCQTLFRKEQIWFTHKDRENTYLYSLAEFTTEKTGVRDTSDLSEKYRKGMFGALPEPDLFQSLLGVKKHG